MECLLRCCFHGGKNLNQMPVAVFDLDGTLRSTGTAIYPRADEVSLYPGVHERLMALRRAGYLLAGVTNQGGVRRGLITGREVNAALLHTQSLLGAARLDAVLHCPHDSGA